MTQYRKPIPKSQKEISRNLIEPYNDGEGRFIGENPNKPSNSNEFQSGVSRDRSQDLSMKNDTVFLLQLLNCLVFTSITFSTAMKSNTE